MNESQDYFYPEEWQYVQEEAIRRNRAQSIIPGDQDQESLSRVLILYTGGTIGMKPTPQGLIPAKNYLRDSLKKLPQFHDPSYPELTTPLSRFGKRIHYVIQEYETLLDSANMSMKDWQRIAEDISANYTKYDAFIIIHGTDTMAYTASALSFMFENLGKTVILTGSQVPLSQEPSDGIDNLLGSLTIAGHCEIPEVCIFFHERLLRGNRTMKWDSTKMDAFRSPNYPPLAVTGVALEVDWGNVLAGPTGRFKVNSQLEENVAVLKLFPGITDQVVRNFLAPPVKGIVLETYGAGNAPSNRPELLLALKEAIDRGVVIVNCTQCPRGTVLQTVYATGMVLNNIGVASGFNMTTTAALTKLACLLAQGLTPEEIKRKMQKNMRGELTPLSKERYSFRDTRFIRSIARGLAETSKDGVVEEHIEKVLLPVLMCAASGSGDLQEVQFLIRHGASVNQGDYDQRTPLHLAVSEGHTEVVKFLLDKGANPSAQDRWGGTPLQDAVRQKHYHLISILTEKEADWKVKQEKEKK